MSTLNNKIDFAIIISATNSNPNGDPLNGNRPRETYDGLGEISDVCLKRKIRNRLQDMGERIFVQSDDRADDGCKSLRERAQSVAELVECEKKKDSEKYAETACKTFFDVRAFGQVFPFKGEKSGDGTSIGIRGPFTIQSAISLDPIEIESLQITKSVSLEAGAKKGSDTMGTKHRINHGLYVTYGSINCQLAEKTGFTDEDAEKIKQALISLFENDESSARPAGSLEVARVIWWKHNCKNGQYSSAKVHKLITFKEKADEQRTADDLIVCELPELACEIYEGY